MCRFFFFFRFRERDKRKPSKPRVRCRPIESESMAPMIAEPSRSSARPGRWKLPCGNPLPNASNYFSRKKEKEQTETDRHTQRERERERNWTAESSGSSESGHRPALHQRRDVGHDEERNRNKSTTRQPTRVVVSQSPSDGSFRKRNGIEPPTRWSRLEIDVAVKQRGTPNWFLLLLTQNTTTTTTTTTTEALRKRAIRFSRRSVDGRSVVSMVVDADRKKEIFFLTFCEHQLPWENE